MPSRLTPSLESWAISRSCDDVAHRVSARLAGRARRRDEAEPVVLPQGLRMHPGELGRDRDHEERARLVHAHAEPLALASRSSRGFSSGSSRDELAQLLLGVLRQVRRHRDLHDGEQVAGALRGVHAATLDPQHAAAGRARARLELHGLAAERGHLDRGAERGLGERHGHVDPQVESVALEDRVLAHGDGEHDVAGLAAVGRRVALAAQADLLPVGDARGHVAP